MKLVFILLLRNYGISLKMEKWGSKHRFLFVLGFFSKKHSIWNIISCCIGSIWLSTWWNFCQCLYNATFIFQNELNSKFSGVEQPAIWNKQTLIFLKNMHIFKRRLKFPNEIWTLSVWYLENMYGQCNINDQYCMVASNDGAINSLHSKVMTLMYLLWVLLYGLSWLHVCNVLLLELKYFSHFCFYIEFHEQGIKMFYNYSTVWEIL